MHSKKKLQKGESFILGFRIVIFKVVKAQEEILFSYGYLQR